MTEEEARRNLRIIRERQQQEPIEKRFDRALQWARAVKETRPLYEGNQRSVEVGESLGVLRASGGGPVPAVCLSDWESKNLTAQWFLREGEPIPPELAAWAADVLADALDIPEAPKRRPWKRREGRKDEGGRDYEVVDLIAGCRSFGLNPVRSRNAHKRVDQDCTRLNLKGKFRKLGEANEIGESGCDIAGLALGLGYWNCRKIWVSRNRNHLPYLTD